MLKSKVDSGTASEEELTSIQDEISRLTSIRIDYLTHESDALNKDAELKKLQEINTVLRDTSLSFTPNADRLYKICVSKQTT